MFLRVLLIIGLTLTFQSCSKKEDVVYKPSSILDPYKLYNEGIEAFEKNDFFS